MTPILDTPPEPGTYRHVLYHPKLAPRNPERLLFYDGNIRARIIEWDGVARQVAFLHTTPQREHAIRFEGWVDITDRWTALLAEDPILRVRRILQSIPGDGWVTPADVFNRAHLASRHEWRRVRETLGAELESIGVGAGVKVRLARAPAR